MMRPAFIVLFIICYAVVAPGGDGSGNPSLQPFSDAADGDSSAPMELGTDDAVLQADGMLQLTPLSPVPSEHTLNDDLEYQFHGLLSSSPAAAVPAASPPSSAFAPIAPAPAASTGRSESSLPTELIRFSHRSARRWLGSEST
jgi:hypothetical protein